MAKNKTNETTKNVTTFVNGIKDETKRDDSFEIIKLMNGQTGFEPKMWGPSIIGFGSYHYQYESGHEGDMPLVAFSPRSTAIVLYLSGSFEKRDELLKKFGKHKTTKGCVYIKKLEDVDTGVLKKMIVASVKQVKLAYPGKAEK